MLSGVLLKKTYNNTYTIVTNLLGAVDCYTSFKVALLVGAKIMRLFKTMTSDTDFPELLIKLEI